MTSDSSQKCFILGFNSQRHNKKTYGNQPKSQVRLTKINPHKQATTSNKSIENEIRGVGAIRNSTSCMSIQWCKLPTLFRSTQIPLGSWDGIKVHGMSLWDPELKTIKTRKVLHDHRCFGLHLGGRNHSWFGFMIDSMTPFKRIHFGCFPPLGSSKWHGQSDCAPQAPLKKNI